jgi:hypothetical protein
MIRHWTPENIEYLEENWGQVSLSFMEIKLEHTKDAILLKAKRIGLQKCYSSSEYVNANVVSQIMKVDRHCIIDYWHAKCGLKARKKALIKMEMWFILLDDLMKWLEKNQEKWDSRKVENYGLGSEPQWLKDKRRNDIDVPKKHNQLWTKEEELLLINYYKHGEKQKEIGLSMNRSEDSIQRKISRLKEKGFLFKQKIICKWSPKEEILFRQLEGKGLSDVGIAEELGREKDHITDHRRNLRNKGLYEGRKINA